MATIIRHGRPDTYRNGCRCKKCRIANTRDCKKRHLRRVMDETPSRVHGTVNGYDNYGCRCELCIFAKVERNLLLKNRRLVDQSHNPEIKKYRTNGLIYCKSCNLVVATKVGLTYDGRKVCNARRDD
jgi:hypothetical protein